MKIWLIASIFIIICCSSMASATSTTISISPSSKILVVGETFNIALIVSPDQDVDTVGVDLLTWNKNVLECLDVQQGNLFLEPLVWLKGKINNTAGKIEWLVVASNAPIHITNTLCVIKFKVKSPGISTIAVEQFAVARNGTELSHTVLNTCQVTVEGTTSLPQPDPPVTPPNNTTNNTIPPNNTSNNTIPPDDTTPPDDTYIPIDNETVTPPTNETTDDNDTIMPPSNNQWDIPTTTIIYLLFSVIVISVSAYAVVRHYKNKQEDDDSDIDDMDDFISDAFGGLDDETSGGDKL